MPDEPRQNRPADYRLGAMRKDFHRLPPEEQVKGNVGVAWVNPDGSIKIKLNPFVVLTHDLTLLLFPNERRDGEDFRH